MTNPAPASALAPARPPLPIAGMVVSALWFIVVALAASDAGVAGIVWFFLFSPAILWGVAWLIRFVVWVHRSRSGHRPPMGAARAWLYWGIEPAVFLLAVALAHGGVFQQARFFLGSSALLAYVQEVQAGKLPVQTLNDRERSAGLYTIYETERLPGGGVRFITSSNGLIDSAGFAYAPAGEPPVIGRDRYIHISGPWWFWLRRF